jgi:exopolysaccharide biosynthesis polyprenyl glycosylphosphotransferase
MPPYQRGLVLIDLLASAAAGMIAYLVRFGGVPNAEYLLVTAALPLMWLAAVAANRGYDACFLGAGASEFQRIFRSFFYLTAFIVVVLFAAKIELARGFVFLALPMTVVMDVLARYAARKRLHRLRMHGRALTRVVVVGHPDRAVDLARAMNHDAYAGFKVVAACVPSDLLTEPQGLLALSALGVPVLGEFDDVMDVVRRQNADTVAVTASSEVGPERLRWISWQLEGTKTELIVSPGLIEVAGTRLHVRPVSGLPLLHVEAPKFSGFHRLLKGAFDRVAAGAALLVLSPLLIVIAVLIRATSRGPVLFRQTRVGRDGTTFTIMKFRSMYLDAEARRASLAAYNEAGDGLLFKIRDDPRVTRVGARLRRFSLDELPQLVNVLLGSMSLVGPRPPLPSEVARYGDDMQRRLLVKPGLTGLWQISGRSDLSWTESVRLDLRYVENWSLALDMVVLWKTARVVLGARGAY